MNKTSKKNKKAFKYQAGDTPLKGYTIRHAAGRGGFGEVYFAESESGKEVALKAIQANEAIELRGVQQCMNLKSPHLVSIHDVKYNEKGEAFVIMEFIWGPSLQNLLDDARKAGEQGLGAEKAAFFIREIGRGLSVLHDSGIVHRDLKPANIFFDQGYVKIGDYGLSKAIAESNATAQTVTVGTVQYMAPEIGQGQYDRGIDIYAMGVMLYEMLTGEVPFAGSTPGEVLMRHLSEMPDLTQIDQPFRQTIKRALAKDPKQRFATMKDMVESLFDTAKDSDTFDGMFAEGGVSDYAKEVKWGVKQDQASEKKDKQSGKTSKAAEARIEAEVEARIERKIDEVCQWLSNKCDESERQKKERHARRSKCSKKDKKRKNKKEKIPEEVSPEEPSPRTRLWALLFALLSVFQIHGIHRFYAGKFVSGFIWFITYGFFFIGQFIDIIMILSGEFTDSKGRYVTAWEHQRRIDTISRSWESFRGGGWRSAVNVAILLMSALLLFAGISLGGALAFEVPELVHLTTSKGELDALKRSIGTTDLKFLISTFAYAVSLMTWCALTLLLVIVRRTQGGWHIGRAIGAVFCLILSLTLMDIGTYIDWLTIQKYFQLDNPSEATNHFLRGVSPVYAVLALLFMNSGLGLLFWPSKMKSFGFQTVQGAKPAAVS